MIYCFVEKHIKFIIIAFSIIRCQSRCHRPVKEAFSVLELSKTNSVSVVQQHLKTHFRKSINKSYKNLEIMDVFIKGKNPERPSASKIWLDGVHGSYECSPQNSQSEPDKDWKIYTRPFGKSCRNNDSL